MKSKKIVLIFIDWFLPGYKAGGPIQSVVNLIHHLGDEYTFHIVTSNKDLGEQEPYPDIPYNVWIDKGNYKVTYLKKKQQNNSTYKTLLKERSYDYIYLNSLFSLNFTIKPLLAAHNTSSNIVLAPRGMLGKGALEIKRRKKQIFLKLFKLLKVSRYTTWHATAETEMVEVQQHFGTHAKVHLASNLSALMPEIPVSKGKEKNQLNLFFLSRISQKKNLKAALEYLLQVGSNYQIQFTIIGPVEEKGYWDSCEEIIFNLPTHVKVNYLGAIPNHMVKERLLDQHFMLLPTFHENFGHVIMESWQNACPVILSDNTPWRGLEQKKIGYDLSLNDPNGFIKAIETAAEMDEAEYREWSHAAFDFAKSKTENPEVLDAYRALFG